VLSEFTEYCYPEFEYRQECDPMAEITCGSEIQECCQLDGEHCSKFGICGTTEEHEINSQHAFSYDECKLRKNKVSKDCKCGPQNGNTSCPLPDQYCSALGYCGTTDQYKTNAQTAFNFRPE